jgi:hypothetical protein
MADLSDVENALVVQVTDALYPQGVSQVSIVGTTCRIYRGWPLTASLNSDLAAGIVNVAIFTAPKRDEVPDPYFDRLYTAISPTSLTASVSGQCVTFAGLVAGNQVVGLLVDGVPFSYQVNANDTNESIAANLTVLISAARLATVSGSTVTIPGVRTMIGRAVTNGTVSKGLRRQRREIQVSFWCPSAALRDAVCPTVDIALTSSPFIALTDETMAHVRYVSTQVYDQSQNALLYRRDLCYLCEYTIISGTVAPVMLFGDLFRNGNTSFV